MCWRFTLVKIPSTTTCWPKGTSHIYVLIHETWWMYGSLLWSYKVKYLGGYHPPQETALGLFKVMKTMYLDTHDFKLGDFHCSLGRSVQLNSFMDVDIAGETTTRRSQTRILIFGNMAPLLWYSKRQNKVEASIFGSEFVAMRKLIEILEGLRYTLWMSGVPLNESCSFSCDN